VHNLGHLIPREYQPHESLNTDSTADDSSPVTSPSTESRGDEGDVSTHEHHAIPIHAAQRDQVSMQKQVNAWLSREERMKAREEKQAIVITEGAHSVSELLSQLNEQR
jgi:hypothetical protein